MCGTDRFDSNRTFADVVHAFLRCNEELNATCQSEMNNQPCKTKCVPKYVAFKSRHVKVCHCLSLTWFMFAWLHLTPHKLHLTERPVVIRQNELWQLQMLLTKPWILNELQPRVGRMDVNKAADVDMARQGYSHLTSMRLTIDDSFMLKSESGCIPAVVLIKGKWQSTLTWIVSNFPN